MERFPEVRAPFPKESDKSPLKASVSEGGAGFGLVGLGFVWFAVPGLLVREFELELGFDAAKRAKRSFWFWGRVGWEEGVEEMRSFNFRGFCGRGFDGAAVDQRLANESPISAAVWQQENNLRAGWWAE